MQYGMIARSQPSVGQEPRGLFLRAEGTHPSHLQLKVGNVRPLLPLPASACLTGAESGVG
jgi:hypothetical protein